MIISQTEIVVLLIIVLVKQKHKPIWLSLLGLFHLRLLLLGYTIWKYHSWAKPDIPQIYNTLSLLHLSVDTDSPWLHQMTCIAVLRIYQMILFYSRHNKMTVVPFLMHIQLHFIPWVLLGKPQSDFSFISYHFALPYQ